ncbi:hypothetical protein AMAG_19000 [Allomyces macrogynus ATCC 38327]|uniref:Uncharacterized protein n=1 Tax=Allomyces macrogynus (strain ATCC 38327) TaxID=578462 RepID=A0A0L0SLY1_ALLM3|nr:hypothetical protein AMAG_19000 [Allomyces macrogynus ATCC 38327]|eukprot:KNE63414.1 hypothetical protein AMAG_19000 [Allomyces macrogynus ATCC 38327]
MPLVHLHHLALGAPAPPPTQEPVDQADSTFASMTETAFTVFVTSMLPQLCKLVFRGMSSPISFAAVTAALPRSVQFLDLVNCAPVSDHEFNGLMEALFDKYRVIWLMVATPERLFFQE